MVGTALITAFVVVAVFAPVLAPYDPLEQDFLRRASPPSWEHLLGTDALGRDLLSRIMYGARVSLLTGIFVVGSTTLIGVAVGSIAGFVGGRVDDVIMRITDTVLAFPAIILAMTIAGTLGPGLFNVMVALVAVGWAGECRVMRAQVLTVKEREFVEGSRALGVREVTVLVRHVIPNCLSPILVMATLGMGGVILSAAALSFLGLGAQPPMPEWGSMLNAGRTHIFTAPHLTVFPGLAIMLVVLGFNFLGDALRDAFDPRWYP